VVSGRVREFLADVMVVAEFKVRAMRGKEVRGTHMVMTETRLLVVDIADNAKSEECLWHKFSLGDFIDTYADKYVLTKLWEFYRKN
jgi:hypothetical protein